MRLRLPVLLALTILCVSCRSFAPARHPGWPAGTTGPQPFPRTVRLHLDGGERLRLFQTSLAADTVVGDRTDGTRVKVPFARIQRVESLQLDEFKTVALIGVVAISGFYIVSKLLPPPVFY